MLRVTRGRAPCHIFLHLGVPEMHLGSNSVFRFSFHGYDADVTKKHT